jgi:hypothetical protein
MNKGFYLKHPILGYFLTFSFLFFPAFTNDYIWSDEYSYQFDLYSLRSDSVANLRPVLGAMTYMNGIFSIDVNGYAFVRLIAVLGLAFAAYEVQLAFANIISSKILFPSIVLALSTFPFQNWIYLGVCAPYCWAAYLSLLAIRIIRSKGSISSIVFGAILVILAIGIYPLAALIPLPIYYIKNFLSRVPRFSALKSNFRLLSFFALTGIVGTPLLERFC